MRKLPNRLQAIADYIENGAAVADIGTDHGLLPVYLALTNKAHRIIASDISAGSLESARRLATRHNVTGQIEFKHTSGLDTLLPADIDTIIIAGVGGETIISILQTAGWVTGEVKNNNLKLILQSQSKLDVLKEYLYNCGYTIKEEKSVADKGRKYKILLI